MDTLREEKPGFHDKLSFWGGGISGEELILARRGKTVRKIKLAQLEGSWGTAQVLGLDAFSWRIDWADVWAFRCISNNTPSVRVRTRGRREVVVSQSQFCLTVNEEGKIVVSRPLNLHPGRSLIPLARKIPGPYRLKWPIDQDKPLNPSSRKPRYPISAFPLTRSFGFFIGRYLANGSVDRDYMVEIARIHPALTEKTVSILIETGLKPHVTESKIRIASVQLARILAGEFGKGATQKRIPGWVFGASPAFREGLLDGYWSHAWISASGMESRTYTDSKGLARDMQALLLSLGIQSSCRHWHYIKKHKSNDEHYIIQLAASSIFRLPRLSHPEKRACQRKWHIPEKDMLCVAPIPRKLVKGRLKDKGSKGFGGFSFVNREASHPQHLKLLERDLMWDVVESIEEDSTGAPLYQIKMVGSAIPVLYSGIVLMDHLCHDL